MKRALVVLVTLASLAGGFMLGKYSANKTWNNTVARLDASSISSRLARNVQVIRAIKNGTGDDLIETLEGNINVDLVFFQNLVAPDKVDLRNEYPGVLIALRHRKANPVSSGNRDADTIISELLKLKQVDVNTRTNSNIDGNQ